MPLVPKQLQRAGMTGNVPYDGGGFTPAQDTLSALRHLLDTAGAVPPGSAAPRDRELLGALIAQRG